MFVCLSVGYTLLIKPNWGSIDGFLSSHIIIHINIVMFIIIIFLYLLLMFFQKEKNICIYFFNFNLQFRIGSPHLQSAMHLQGSTFTPDI